MKTLVFTFDDACASHFSMARPLLKKYGQTGTFFVTANKDKLWMNPNPPESKEEGKKPCTAILVSVWNGVDKSTLRIDLWTKEMPIDEMKIFFHQSLLSMADTFEKATGETAVTGDLRDYCHHFAEKMKIFRT